MKLILSARFARQRNISRTIFSDPLTLEEVSEIVGLSTAYFSALFKKTEGEGFAKYLINVRMEQAKLLLRESNPSSNRNLQEGRI